MNEIIFYRSVTGKTPVEDFLDTLTDKQFKKVSFVFDLIEQLETVPQEYLKKLKGTEGIWEVRVRHANNIFRFLGFIDKKRLVVLNHAFVKKSQKTPKKEIQIAEKRKKEYFKRKVNHE
jgi:phage-related protein